MDSKIINQNAMDLLKTGNFQSAQTLLRKNCKENPSFQTFNNIGRYYYENGMDLLNGKQRSAHSMGKRYLQKSLLMNKTTIVLNNLGQIEYEWNKNFEKALQYYEESYQLNTNLDVLYNISAALYQLKEYSKSVELVHSLIDYDPESYTIYLFSMLKIEPSIVRILLNNPPHIFEKIDPDLKIILYAHFDMYDKVMLMSKAFISEWSPDITIWSILIESFYRANMDTKKIEEFICKETEDYEKKEILRLCSENIRKQYIIKKEVYFAPVIKEFCGYFGCPIHHTPFYGM